MPPGVVLLEEGLVDSEAFAVYALAGSWRARVSVKCDLPWDGPEALELGPLEGGEPAALNGISAATLRSLPLSDARMRLRRLRASALVPAEDIEALTSRDRGLMSLARFARVYARAVNVTRQPIVVLSAASGVSPKTLEQRALRARQRGLLTPPVKGCLGRLTVGAEKMLAGEH